MDRHDPTDWPYLKITPDLLAEVRRLEGLGIDQETAVAALAENFREKLLRVLAGPVPDYPPDA
jgi:hypothetical protein